MYKAMVIDDDAVLRYVVRKMLESDGAEVVEAPNGIDALVQLNGAMKVSKPDVILLDIVMPGMDGYTFQGKVEEDPVLKAIPVVVMTGRTHMKELFALCTNVAAILEKPFEPEDLLKAVKTALARKNKS